MNNDIINEILMHLSLEDIKSFLLVNKSYQLKFDFWKKKIIHDKLPLNDYMRNPINYTMVDYERLYRATQKAKRILKLTGSIQKINPKYIPSNITNALEKTCHIYVAVYVTIEQLKNYTVTFYTNTRPFPPPPTDDYDEWDYIDDITRYMRFEIVFTYDELSSLLIKSFTD
jgi:hypothetical protein